MASILFKPSTIGNLEIKNRFVRSATHDGKADENGMVTKQQVTSYEELAKGGVGLLIAGVASVHPTGKFSAHQLDISGDNCIAGLKQLVESVHKYDSKIAAQLGHIGREADRYVSKLNIEAVAPSVIKDDPYFDRNYREISESEILEIIDAFGSAARRAQVAGFDAIQLHGAHVFIISQFLSPFTNRRTDAWGGTPHKRFRFLEEVYKAVRKEVGEDYPLMIKLGVEDGFPEGLRFEEGKLYAQRCEEIGFCAIEVSQGLRGKYFEQTEFKTGIDSRDKEAYFRLWAKEVKRNATVPIITVGGLRSALIMEEILENNEADFIAICRPLIRQPDLISTWEEKGPSVATCISCNACYLALREKGEPLHCVFDDERYKLNDR